MKRRCERVSERLPDHVAGELGRWQERRLVRHLSRCDDCRASAERQRAVAADLARLGAAADADLAGEEPPADLLDELLAAARTPDLRARAAVPARGAVSGARPGLSVALLVVVVALAAGAGWLGWRLGSRVRRRRG